ncbi:NAD-dependent epimerase/dehydratase family protein [Hoyosella sp. G463]|uniref:NAD-dependent epimerase/dehydratase family protein n=1 Tax=Lolliginicoccus lacisalsi TaxID=2742202 RepID=A0A927JD60_9ACTN|nr:NAD-dependent epimerase/dehydratase family protein [Lolliginicoccus lacisalsi]MBD8507159.1 NAD-dependent epimerase/dehydratase family protein [Lolliginicoccus lacisalsi]
MIASRILILGCGGYIGSHLLDRVLAIPGVRVTGWDTSSAKIDNHLDHPGFEFHRAHLASPEAIAALEPHIARADVVMNLAAICNPAEYVSHPLRVLHSNLFDTYQVPVLCAQHQKWLIHFSTSEVYGRTIASYLPGNTYDDPDLYELREDSTPLIMGPISNLRWTYASAKQVMERLIHAYHEETGMPYTLVRPLNFFGPRMDYLPGHDGEGTPRVLASFMSALIDGTPMRLVDDGKARRTIVSIEDAVDALMLMLDNPTNAQNQIFNIGNPGNEVTMRELAELMRGIYATITGDDGYRDHPIESVSSLDFYGPGYEDCDRRMPNIENAKIQLGWTPRKNLPDLLRETMTAFHQQYVAQGG